jgi:hypothetical protein
MSRKNVRLNSYAMNVAGLAATTEKNVMKTSVEKVSEKIVKIISVFRRMQSMVIVSRRP